MRDKEFLSCSEAAVIMGVSRSTVKRYCESGELRNHKTLGQHRRIDSEDVARWLSGQQNKSRKRNNDSKKNRNFSPAFVADCLLNSATKKLDALIERVVLRQVSVAELIDHQIAPAMWEIGHRWHSGTISFTDERRATSNLKLLYQTLSRCWKPEINAPVAIGGTLEGDQADLGSMAIELVARNAGYEAYHVGTNLPAETLAQIASQLKASVVWVSYCHIDNEKRVLDSHDILNQRLNKDVPLAIGGYALHANITRYMEYDFHGATCLEFEKFLQSQLSRN